MERKPVAIVGFAKRGKTTLVCAIVRELASRGISVAVIKHTHHLLTDDDTSSGDTGRALEAGATAALLATGGRAVMWRRGAAPVRFDWPSLETLLAEARANAELVLVEGFKHEGEWPQIALVRDETDLQSLQSQRIVAVVADESLAVSSPQFRSSDVRSLADFVDTISRQ